jgi:3'-phosphoadenosine 5'-phosphosulfate sulfotransferase (PAPS reductase)/FAD synthetase
MATMKEVLESVEKGDGIRHLINISGGKDSAALAVYLNEHYPEIQGEYIFCDTLCELPETYEYLERLEILLGVEVQRINAFEVLGIEEKPGRNPFETYLKELYGGFLPSPRMRWCTKSLKIAPFEKFVGDDKVFSYIGIRGDEDREGYQSQKKPPVMSERPNIVPVYPFKDDGLGLQDIKSILDDSGLGLPSYYDWRSRSGCYFCFYQQIGEWQGLKEHHPQLFEIAKSYEKPDGDRPFTWVEGKTLDEIAAMERRDIQDKDDTDGCAICHL